jgi:hypothetical protein
MPETAFSRQLRCNRVKNHPPPHAERTPYSFYLLGEWE